MTEEEAKTKWCPMVRYISHQTQGQPVNRWANADDRNLMPEPALCLGSACMMWREISEMQEKRHAPLGVKERVVVGHYCGLAGKP